MNERERGVERIESEIYNDSTTGLLKPLTRKSPIRHLKGKPMSPIGQARKRGSRADRNSDTHSTPPTKNSDPPEQGLRQFDNSPNQISRGQTRDFNEDSEEMMFGTEISNISANRQDMTSYRKSLR